MAINRAPTSAIECNNGKSPVSGNGCAISDIRRHWAVWPEPDIYPRALPLHRVHSSTIVIKRGSVRIWCGSRDTTSSTSITCVTIRVTQWGTTLGGSYVDCAASWRVQRDIVSRLGVNPFDNINFSACRPIWPNEPVGWPCPTLVLAWSCNTKSLE